MAQLWLQLAVGAVTTRFDGTLPDALIIPRPRALLYCLEW
jgi:hypothetical protein